MDRYGHDGDMTNEYGGISVDDILAEYQQEERAAASQALYQSYLDQLPDGDEGFEPEERSQAVDEEGVKLYRPKSAIAAMEEEAREYVSRRMRDESASEPEPYHEAGESSPQWEDSQADNGDGDELPWPEDFLDSGAETAPAEEYPEDIEIDERFVLSGRREEAAYDGAPLDLGPEEDYIPASEPDWSPSHWSGDEGESGEEPETAPAEGRGGLFARIKAGGKKRGKKSRPLNAPPAPEPEEEDDYASAYTEPEDGLGDYAPAGDYDYYDEDLSDELPEDDSFPSFKEYVFGLVTGFIFRIKGAGPKAVSDTMEEDDEDLGTELSPAAASKYYGSFVHSLRLRFRIVLALLLIMCYISLGLPLAGMLKTTQVQAAMCLAIQLCIMLLSLDIVTGSAINLARGRFGADSLAILACLLTSIDALAVALDGFGSPHTPLCFASSLTLAAVLLSSLLSARGLRKALRVPAIGKRAYAVTGEPGLKGSGMTLLKSTRPVGGFVRRAEEAAPDETLFLKLSLPLLALALLLALIVCFVKKSWGDFLYVFTALLISAVPLTALLSFALPFFVGSMRIFSSGAAIAGWSGLCDLGQTKNLIVTDRDLFPEGTVEIDSIRIFADAPSEKIISYAGTMIAASGSSVASCFGELMEKNGSRPRHVENYEYLSGGGMRGIIDGEVVLCGSTDLMRLMNVRIPYRLIDKTTVLLAIDGVLYGIFNMKYSPQPQVRKALVSLMRSNRHPVFAIRDFNVTPEMLHQNFDVATDGYDFPPYVERYAISEAESSDRTKIAGVICREGLGPLTHMADTGRSMYLATRINLIISIAAALSGLALVFIKFLTVGGIGLGLLLFFMLLWAVPVTVISFLLKF